MRREVEFVGRSKWFNQIQRYIDRTAKCGHPALIMGETGTGKDMVFKRILALSSTGKHNVVINCPALPDSLLENELFGHERGSYTGADKVKNGLLEKANQGTLVLDEIGELSTNLQAKLLGYLGDKVFRRVGGIDLIKSDARIIAATNKDLRESISSGSFRSDLFYRFETLTAVIPPLRERVEDIPVLVNEFLLGTGRDISPEALNILQNQPWPGNVRELRSCIECVVSLVMDPEDEIITPDHLNKYFQSKRLTISNMSLTFFDTLMNEPKTYDEFKQRLHELEREFVSLTLRKHGGNQTRTANTLGLSESSMSRLVRNLRIDADKIRTKKFSAPPR